MEEHTLLEQLRDGDAKAYRYIYKQFYRMIATYVGKNNGDDEDAKDLFQETILALMDNLRKPDFSIKVKVGTYFYSIARFIWIKKLKKRGLTTSIDTQSEGDKFIEISESVIEEKVQQEKKHELIAQKLGELGEVCRKIITDFYLKKKKLKEIAEEMGYTNDFVRVKRMRCMNKFKKNIQKDMAYHTLIKEA